MIDLVRQQKTETLSMTNLIDSGNSQKIQHLEKMRQKILKDIIKKNSSFYDVNNR